jgi:hypothetical protein
MNQGSPKFTSNSDNIEHTGSDELLDNFKILEGDFSGAGLDFFAIPNPLPAPRRDINPLKDFSNFSGSIRLAELFYRSQ